MITNFFLSYHRNRDRVNEQSPKNVLIRRARPGFDDSMSRRRISRLFFMRKLRGVSKQNKLCKQAKLTRGINQCGVQNVVKPGKVESFVRTMEHDW
jgi:hypothetical protein